MKKTTLITVALLLLAVSISAANVDTSTLPPTLTLAEKNAYYEANSKPVVLPIVLNSTVGFGLGSAIAGDGIGFITGVVLDSVSVTAVIGGFGLFLTDLIIQSNIESMGGVKDENSEVNQIATTMFFSGLGGLVLSRIVQGTMVGLFTSNHNNALKQSLDLVPVVDIVGSNGIYLGAKLAF